MLTLVHVSMPSPDVVRIPGISRDELRPAIGMENISGRRIHMMGEEEILAHRCTYGSMLYIFNTRTMDPPIGV